jgi:hypothetical protein
LWKGNEESMCEHDIKKTKGRRCRYTTYSCPIFCSGGWGKCGARIVTIALTRRGIGLHVMVKCMWKRSNDVTFMRISSESARSSTEN